MVEDLGFPRFGLGDEGIVKDIEDVLADILQFRLDLLTIVTDGGNVLISTLGLLLLLDRGDYTPGRTAGAHYVLVRDREQVAFINGQLATKLRESLEPMEIGGEEDCAAMVGAWTRSDVGTFATS
jgi:hypothetical protein